MKRSAKPTLRAFLPLDACSDSVESGLSGMVVLLDVEEPSAGARLAMRYAKRGADLAIAHANAAKELLIVQQQIEALGNRCVLYEVDLADEWNCGLVLQSARECLGSIDLVVARTGHVRVVEKGETLEPHVVHDDVVHSAA